MNKNHRKVPLFHERKCKNIET